MSSESETTPSIAELSQEATYDSSGHFTLAEEEALRRLQNFALPRASAWILKVVQAAVASGAGLFNVARCDRGVCIEFWTTAKDWTLDNLQRALTAPAFQCPESLHCLRLGFWGLTALPELEAEIQIPCHTQSLIWRNGTFEVEKGEPRSPFRLILKCPNKAPDVLKLANLREELEKYAFAAPLTINFEGTRLGGLLRSPVFQGGPKRSFISLQVHEGVALPKTKFFASWEADLPGTLKAFSDSGQVGALACLITPKEIDGLPVKPLQIFWLAHGILVDQESLPMRRSDFACTLFAPCDGLKLDLSGLQLIRSEPGLDKRRRSLLALAATETKLPALARRYTEVAVSRNPGCLGSWLLILACFMVLPIFLICFQPYRYRWDVFRELMTWGILLTSPVTIYSVIMQNDHYKVWRDYPTPNAEQFLKNLQTLESSRSYPP